MLKENTGLINKDLLELEKSYTYVDIVDMIEMSYSLAEREEMNKFDELIQESTDGIMTYGAFVKFCYDKYIGSGYTGSAIDFIKTELEENIEEFKEKYFIDTEYEDTRKCLEFIDKQFEETKNKENTTNALDMIDEIIEQLNKKYRTKGE